MSPLMAEIALCEPWELFNLLNQRTSVCKLAEINYLHLIDARETEDYDTSHIITATQAKTDTKEAFVLFENVETDTMQNIVVYDGNTDHLHVPGRAQRCATVVARSSLCTVYILRGGFEKFSSLYPFLRTEKILYTVKEVEDLGTYPVEIIPGKVFMGDKKQSHSESMMEDLKITAVVHVWPHEKPRWATSHLCVDVGNEAEKPLCSQDICDFIDSQTCGGSRVLIVSPQGSRRCSTVATAYAMHHFRMSLQVLIIYIHETHYPFHFNGAV